MALTLPSPFRTSTASTTVGVGTAGTTATTRAHLERLKSTFAPAAAASWAEARCGSCWVATRTSSTELELCSSSWAGATIALYAIAIVTIELLFRGPHAPYCGLSGEHHDDDLENRSRPLTSSILSETHDD